LGAGHWGGGFFPDDAFFDACDEQGLVVWHDLLFACNVYDLTPSFIENIRAETADNVRRIRHHACLGLWCGNNEMEWHWLDLPGIACHSERYKRMYLEQFERILPEVVAENDPDTFYWPASPSSGGGFDDPNAEDRGNMHIWDVWHGLKPFTDYRRKFPRFCSEFGFESYANLETIRSFTSPDDLNAFSPIMEAHQKRPGGNSRIAYYLSEQYLQPCTFEQMVYASQLLQAEALRHGVEHWRRNRGRCMGAIYWQLNDNWPVASWSSIDYSGRWKASHYAARRFFAPVFISAVETYGSTTDFEDTPIESMRPIDGATLHIGNERRNGLEGIMRWVLCDPDSSVLQEGTVPVSLQPMEAKPIAELDFSTLFLHGTDRGKCYLRFAVEENGTIEAEGTLLFVPPRRFDFHDPKIVWEVEETDEHFRIRIRSESYAQAVTIGTGSFICVLSDNAFDLHGGEERTVTTRKSELPDDVTAERFQDGLMVLSVKDIGRISGREGN
jgi:beta-mannosidase